MGLADAIAAATADARPAGCSVGALLSTMDAADADVLRSALDDGVVGTVLAAALKAEGHDVSAYTLQRHRRGTCRCDR